MRTLALPETVKDWSLTSLREKLVKIGAKIVGHARYITFQIAEVAVPSRLFGEILWLIDGLRLRPISGDCAIHNNDGSSVSECQKRTKPAVWA